MNRTFVISYRTVALFATALVLALSLLPMLVRVVHADGGPTINATLSANVPGASATISGSGFAANETVHVSLGAQSKDVVADGSGNISGVALTIPTVPAGLQFVSAWGETSGTWALTYVWIAGFQPNVIPNSWYVLPGATLSFTGIGFGGDETVTASYNSSPIGTFTTDSSGNFSGAASSSLPVSLQNTQATITFLGATSGAQTSDTISIGQLYPSITPSTWYAAAGSAIGVSGSGFAPNEMVNVIAGSSNASSTADTNGNFSLESLQLPKGGGTVSITATGAQSGATATVGVITVIPSPWITFSTYWAPGGSPLTVFGNNFAGGEQVSVTSGPQNLGTTTADINGNFSLSTTVPTGPSGPATITATGVASGASAQGTLTIAPQ